MTKLYYIGFSDWFREHEENLLFISVTEAKETEKTYRVFGTWRTRRPTFQLDTESFFSPPHALDFLTKAREPHQKIFKKKESILLDITSSGVISTDFQGICDYYEMKYSNAIQTENNESYRLEQIKKLKSMKAYEYE